MERSFFSFLYTKDGLLLVGGWAFVWIALERVFFGEAVFRYSSSAGGRASYIVLLAFIVVASCLVGFVPRLRDREVKGPGLVAVGAAGAASLLLSRAFASSGLAFAQATLWLPGIVYAASFCIVCAAWSRRMESLVFDHGLPWVLAASLVGILLSFVALPSVARDTFYGIAVVVASPLASALCLAACGGAAVPPGSERPPRSVSLALAMVALFSLLVHALAYVEFSGPGYVAVEEENPYAYAFMFASVLLLGALASHLDTNSNHEESAFLCVLLAAALLTFLVLFALFVNLSSGEPYLHDATKMLRRIIKVVVFFLVSYVVYRNGVNPAASMLLVLVVPATLSKLVQMLLPSMFGGGTVALLSGIGFMLVVCWTLLLLFHMSGAMAFLSAGKGENDTEPDGATSEPEQAKGEEGAARSIAAEYGFTDRELEVLKLLARGHSARHISEALFVSQNTVKTHVSSIYRKTGLHSRQEIIDLVAVRSQDC